MNLELLPERIQRKIHVTDSGCWEWTAGRDRQGYGRVRWAPRGYALAHRVVYELLVGPIPAGLHIHHVCEVTACVNPAHLVTIHPSDHAVLAGVAAEHLAQTHCVHGHSLEDAYPYNGRRACRECGKRRSREYRKRKAASA